MGHSTKIAVCIIVRHENVYLRFWCEYMFSLGFDTIILGDNNRPDEEKVTDVIGDMIKDKRVILCDLRGGCGVQAKFYGDAYAEFGKLFSWIAFFDCDEFLLLPKGYGIHEFMEGKEFSTAQMIHFNWKCFDDNGKLSPEQDTGRNMKIENLPLRFPVPRPVESVVDYSFPENYHVKSMIRGGIHPELIKFRNPHTIIQQGVPCKNPDGIAVSSNSPFMIMAHNTAYLRHYCTKTIYEFINFKVGRGLGNNVKNYFSEHDPLEYFFKRNIWTKEKEEYGKKLLSSLRDNRNLI
jgi:hypothetical protein